MKKSFALIVIMFSLLATICIFGYRSVAYAQNNINTTAKSMIVIAGNDNRVLYAKNENEKLPMASTTKIVTALTVINNTKNLDEVVTITKESTLVEGTSIYLKQGEKLTIKQLLYGLMLQSGNDAATALALHVGGSIDGFCQLMAKTAVDCGATNSSFKNPHGLDQEGHYTTASDLAKITAQALKNQIFKDIVSCKYYEIDQGENIIGRKLSNKNRLLNSLEGCIGVKTGYTSKAGRCLVSAAERNNMQVICVVLNCRPMFEESVALIEQAFEEYSLVQLLLDYNFVTDIAVRDGNKDSVKIYSRTGLSKVLSNVEKEQVSITYDYPEYLKAPLKKGQKVGQVKIIVNNDLIFDENLYIMEEVKSINLTDKINNIIDNWNR